MVQKESCDGYVARFGVGPLEPIEDIHGDRLDIPGQRCKLLLGVRGQQLLAVHQYDARWLPAWRDLFCELEQQSPVTCAKLHNRPRRPPVEGYRQCSSHGAGVSH